MVLWLLAAYGRDCKCVCAGIVCAGVRECVCGMCVTGMLHLCADIRNYAEITFPHSTSCRRGKPRDGTGLGLLCSALVWSGSVLGLGLGTWLRSWALILADVAVVVVALKISAGAAAEKCFLHKRFSLLRLSSLRDSASVCEYVCACVRVCAASFDVALFVAHVVFAQRAAVLYYLFSLEMLLLFSFH